MSNDFNNEEWDRTVVSDGSEQTAASAGDWDQTVVSEPGSAPAASPVTFNTVSAGTVVGNYRVLKPISEGGMGKIFLCHPLDDFNCRLVLKVLRSEMKTKTTGRERFRREFKLLHELSHENIVQTYDSWSDNDAEYFVMEFVSGMNLSQMVQLKYVFSSEYCLYMMGVLANAMRYAWDSCKLLHRDIKPSNIMIDDNNIIKILDFGIAKSLLNADTVLTMDGASLGSPGFMSPEQYLDPRHVDCTSDIFSLGATVYFCLSGGRLPYPGKNIAEIAMSMRKGYVQPIQELNPEVPDNFAELIMATLHNDPKKRPFCWAKLLASIDRIARGGRMVK